METKELTEAICSFLSSKKAEDIVIADVREKTTLCDCFIIASGRNSTQVRTLCENLEEHLSKAGFEPLRTEGVRDALEAVGVGAAFAGRTFVDLLGNCPGEVTLDESGCGVFSVNGGSVSVWGLRPEAYV